MEYNGHRSWNAWNVSLWINNNEALYNQCRYLVEKYGRKRASRMFAEEMTGQTTPDGARYNPTVIYEAMEGMND